MHFNRNMLNSEIEYISAVILLSEFGLNCITLFIKKKNSKMASLGDQKNV